MAKITSCFTPRSAAASEESMASKDEERGNELGQLPSDNYELLLDSDEKDSDNGCDISDSENDIEVSAVSGPSKRRFVDEHSTVFDSSWIK